MPTSLIQTLTHIHAQVPCHGIQSGGEDWEPVLGEKGETSDCPQA